jgi:hypothetical protein
MDEFARNSHLVQSREGQVCSTGLHGKMTQDIIGEDGVERTHLPALEVYVLTGRRFKKHVATGEWVLQ